MMEEGNIGIKIKEDKKQVQGGQDNRRKTSEMDEREGPLEQSRQCRGSKCVPVMSQTDTKMKLIKED